MPGVLSLELLLANNGRAAVWIGDAFVYPTGAVFTVVVHRREEGSGSVDPSAAEWRFGVQFPDGRKATVYGSRARGVRMATASTVTAHVSRNELPDGPLLQPRGGGGGATHWRQDFWLWPLPPRGELLLACEWPELGVELSTAVIQGELVLEAASRARELWPEPDLPDWPES